MKRLVFALILLLAALTLPAPVSAAVTCDAAGWDPNSASRNLQVCVGGFATPEALRQAVVEYKCTSNSQIPGVQPCHGNTTITFNLKDTGNSNIAGSAGNYYTCPLASGLNRAIGTLSVSVREKPGDPPTVCIPSLATAPSDWGTQPEDEMGVWNTQGENANLSLCERFANNDSACVSCIQNKGSWTAIGCIPSSPADFVSILLSFGVGIAGGIAFLLILFGGFQILTSAGNPEQLNAGRELVGSAVTGLILIVLSIFLLRLIGVTILGIPGFT